MVIDRRFVAWLLTAARVVGFVVVVALVASPPAGYYLYHTTRANAEAMERHLREALANLESSPGSLTDQATLERARAELARTRERAMTIRQRLAVVRFVEPALAAIPIVGGDLHQSVGRVADVTAIGVDLTELVAATLDEAATIETSSQVTSGQSNRSMTAVMTAVSARAPTLRALAASAASLQARIDALDEQPTTTMIAGQSTQRAVVELTTNVGPKLEQVARGLTLTTAVARALGGDGPRTYLVMSQNDHELRPTGGFVGSLGVVTVENGRIRQARYFDSRAFDSPVDVRVHPPDNLLRYLPIGYWHLRDANWSPDFPTSARTMLDFYALAPRPGVDGVIAIDLWALETLLEATGPVVEPETGETVSADNVIARVDHHIHGPGRQTNPTTKPIRRRRRTSSSDCSAPSWTGSRRCHPSDSTTSPWRSPAPPTRDTSRPTPSTRRSTRHWRTPAGVAPSSPAMATSSFRSTPTSA